MVASNVERVQRLIDAGRMREAGQREIDAAKADGRWPLAGPRIRARRHAVPAFERVAERRGVGVAQPL